jgi:formamidopyrimidine-DNA glycosylase
MPERPDLDYVVPILDRELRGRRVIGVRVRKPVVFRLAVEGTPEVLLTGVSFAAVRRRGHFVLFELAPPSPLEIVVSPMLAGRFALAPVDMRKPGDLAAALLLDDGRELRYRDDVQMGKIYVIPHRAWDRVPGLASIGLDILDPETFTLEAFSALAHKRRDQVKVFLLDKSALDSFGNAYADEALWEARIHPKRLVRSLDEEELGRLHAALPKVVGGASATIAARRPALDEKVRDFLHVRGRAGEPCHRCGVKLRKARVHADDSIFCPACQPDARGTAIVDWRKAGR